MVPIHVDLGGRRWEIVEVPDLDSAGLCDPATGKISYSPGQHPWELRDTILHEIGHAVCRSHGRVYTKTEETYVAALASGYMHALRDNRELARWLFLDPT